ncbi:hypothetical protein [Paraburkholderia sp. GAS348]|uniref:hypothetical protein n=1 Tax=Paraburkholderia sp. GAS348 TaxID=3035132 RepID=UPI003D22052F
MHDVVGAPEQSRNRQAARKPAGIRIREAIKEECERQRAALARKEAADAQITLLGSILGELLSQADFVAVLEVAGFTAIPRLVQQRLQPRFPETRAVPAKQDTGSDTTPYKQGNAVDASEDAAAIPAGQTLPARTIQALGRMVPVRRTAVANLMNAVDNLTGDFAHALLAATPEGMRVTVARSERVDSSRARSFARIEKRLMGLHAKNQMLSAGHNDNLRYLAVCASYVRGWTHNRHIVAWLRLHYPVHAASLEQIAQEADCAKEPKRAMKLPYPTESALAYTEPSNRWRC